jgi:hypothetical protein
MHEDPVDMDSATDVAVLVSSCDRFQDLWRPFFKLFRRFWPDCAYPVFLITNQLDYAHDAVTTLKCGPDRGWASNMRAALRSLPFDYLLYMQEDYLIHRSVDDARIRSLIGIMRETGAGCLRLYPCPGPDTPLAGFQDVGLISKGSDYRVSLQAAVWDKRTLGKLLVDGETGWEMELRGTKRSDRLDVRFLSVPRDPVTEENSDPALPYLCTAVVRGKWRPDAVEFCRSYGIEIDLARRPVLSPSDNGDEPPTSALSRLKTRLGRI